MHWSNFVLYAREYRTRIFCRGKPMTRSKTTSSNRKNEHIAKLTTLCLAVIVGFSAISNIGCCIGHSGSSWLFHTIVEGPLACYRERVWAKRAFNLCYPRCEHPYPSDFRAGFIEGYCNACNGGDATPPPLPPRSYWESRYKSEEGAEMVDAWFAGYPAGFAAAKKDGAANDNQLQISQEIAAAMSNVPIHEVNELYGSALPAFNYRSEENTHPVQEPVPLPIQSEQRYNDSPASLRATPISDPEFKQPAKLPEINQPQGSSWPPIRKSQSSRSVRLQPQMAKNTASARQTLSTNSLQPIR